MLDEVKNRKVFHYEDLEVWKKAFEVSLLIHRETLNFPKIEQYALADKIRRSTKSICANIAQGFSKQRASKAEFKRFIVMALASANEVLVWLKYCVELGYIKPEQYKSWYEEHSRICRMLNVLHAKS
jgi:four helix bundle protein